MGTEDDSQVSWSPGPRLHPVMERRTCLQRHHPQEQVSLLRLPAPLVMAVN